jgi:histidinol dehydrogenase
VVQILENNSKKQWATSLCCYRYAWWPSELLIVADDNAVPALWHLICCLQAEHGIDSQRFWYQHQNSSTLLNRNKSKMQVLPEKRSPEKAIAN